jgi:hypothetical protein
LFRNFFVEGIFFRLGFYFFLFRNFVFHQSIANMSSFVPKTFNYCTEAITGDVTLTANTYNVILGSALAAPANVTLPLISRMLNGSPLIVLNNGSFTITVYKNDGITVLVTVLAGQTASLLADLSNAADWIVQSAPASSTDVVSGPLSSTDTALARWNGTSGQILENSVVTLDGAGALSGVSGLTLATTGGTPTQLNYYEEYTLSGNTFGGGVTVAQPCDVRISRVGDVVTALFPSISGTGAAGLFTSSLSVPARFLPVSGGGAYGYYKSPVIVQNNSLTATAGQTSGELQINLTTGIITVGLSSASGAAVMTAGNSAGWAAFSLNWRL